jgi:hypothetical protein
MGRGWRPHEDTDVGVVRADLGAVHEFLRGWDLHIAAAGRLTPWGGEPLDAARDQNNVWCRQVPGGPWVLDITIGDGTDDHWVYRRDPSIRLRWDAAVLRTADGVPYLAPELQLLFKSKGMRPKDNADAAEVIPHLDDLQRGRLQQWLPQEHPWR